MNLQVVLGYIESLNELTDDVKVKICDFIKNNEEEVSVSCETVGDNPFVEEYKEIVVDGPNDFSISMTVGYDTDYLNLNDINYK